LAKDAGFGGKTDDEKVAALMAAIDRLKSDIGIKPCIQDYGIAENDFLAGLDAMAEAAFDDQCTGANPRYPLIEEIKRMYRNAYYGKADGKGNPA
jgi:acetaldehyde dehydrogenase/alcohol dehydrogenase